LSLVSRQFFLLGVARVLFFSQHRSRAPRFALHSFWQ
jgi:hypothetical protein